MGGFKSHHDSGSVFNAESGNGWITTELTPIRQSVVLHIITLSLAHPATSPDSQAVGTLWLEVTDPKSGQVRVVYV